MLGGLILTGFGFLVTYDGLLSATERVLPLRLQSVIFFGPSLLAVGCVTFLRGLPLGASVIFRRGVLMIGLLMLAIGGWPWLYISYLTGGRPGNEGDGMLGTIIFIYVGLPGLALTLTSLVMNVKSHKRGKSDA